MATARPAGTLLVIRDAAATTMNTKVTQMELPSLPSPLRAHRTLPRLDDAKAIAVLQLAARLGQMATWPGTAFHAVLGRWLETDLAARSDLDAWVREEAPRVAGEFGVKLSAKIGERAGFDRAWRQAEQWWRQGWRVHAWEAGHQPLTLEGNGFCPQVLFSRGEVPSDRCRVALFNSRKPRRFHSREPWLLALREVLAALAALPVTLVSSRGTLSYDLVSCFAEIRGMSLALVTTDEPCQERGWAELRSGTPAIDESQFPAGCRQLEHSMVLTCALHPGACPKPRRMVCRDRLLAHLADLHVVLALRDHGNLLGILRAQQQVRTRWQWIVEPSEDVAAMRGNRVLAKEFPQWQRALRMSEVSGLVGPSGIIRNGLGMAAKGEIPPTPPLKKGGVELDRICPPMGREEPQSDRSYPPFKKGGRGDFQLRGGQPVPSTSIPAGPASRNPRPSLDICWERYLYHYTRACPGPWPGQTEFEYLASVLDGEPSCGHSALDTLVRILTEGRIRGSHRLVRGLRAVISWTSRPPQELSAIRHWNRALGRWTFEPYGLAVNRQCLRKLGAKPAVYGADALFERLPPQERFRFQVGNASRSLWRREREWRLLGDLQLDPRLDVLILVPDRTAADRIAGEIPFPYRLVVS